MDVIGDTAGVGLIIYGGTREELQAKLRARDDRIAELEAALAASEADARRYRYLRDRDLETIHMGGVFAGRVPENVVVNGDDLDAAIDWAMTPTEN
jgi:hypothetical protein